MVKPMLVVGAGSWGTALALVLADNGQPVYLWGHDPQHMAVLQTQGCNQRYLANIQFPATLTPTADLATCLQHCDSLVISVPYVVLRDVLTLINRHTDKPLKLCLTSKGLEAKTHYLAHQIAQDCLGDDINTVALSGPSFAKEVANHLPTSVVIAGTDIDTVEFFADKFHNDYFRTYTHDDIIGVQIGGAIKNIMAIAAGVSDGLCLGANARAALISRGLAEITRLGVSMGGQQQTFMGLAGVGDLVLTCTDDQSRNRRFGYALAKHQSTADICQAIDQTIEGLNVVDAVSQLAQQKHIQMPITQQVYKLIHGNVSPQQALAALLARSKKQELECYSDRSD